jgi:uncharacterized protein YndB with AHSA1/START domain
VALRVAWPDGREMEMRGVHQEIVPPERFVSTESFDDYPGESLNTLVLTEEDSKTTLAITVPYQSQEIRDAVMVIKSGMEHGAAECYDKLAELLASLGVQGWREEQDVSDS